MQSYLFIGGQQDGQNIPVADDVEFMQFSAGVTGRETYIRDTLAVGGYESVIFYRHDGLTPEEVLDHLAKHYIAWCVKQQPSGRR
jgi:hypothetical protein